MELERLADIAASQPQAAYSALTFSLKHKWSLIARTTKDISELLQPVEDTIHHKVLPAITGKQAISDADRKLFTLLVSLGGLRIPILLDVASHELSNSALVTEPLVKYILKQSVENATEIEAQQKSPEENQRSE